MMDTLDEGTIVQLGRRRYALQAWEPQPKDNGAEDQVYYVGYSRRDWEYTSDPSVNICQFGSGNWQIVYGADVLLPDGSWGPRDWHTIKTAKIVGDAHKLWAQSDD